MRLSGERRGRSEHVQLAEDQNDHEERDGDRADDREGSRRELRDTPPHEEGKGEEHDRDDPPERRIAADGRLRQSASEQLLGHRMGREAHRRADRDTDEDEHDESDQRIEPDSERR